MGTKDLELVRFAMIPTLDVAATVAMAMEGPCSQDRPRGYGSR
jgi:hypothetical protein